MKLAKLRNPSIEIPNEATVIVHAIQAQKHCFLLADIPFQMPLQEHSHFRTVFEIHIELLLLSKLQLLTDPY